MPHDDLVWILASNSPRRKELLGRIMDVTVIGADVDESVDNLSEPGKIVEELAFRKASVVYEHLLKAGEETGKEDLYDPVMKKAKELKATKKYGVIGADTIVYHNGKVLGKPKDEEDAFRMLKSLSGQTHSVYTGVAVLSPFKRVVFHSETKVTFDSLPEDEIRKYIETGEPMDKAGAYGIQGAGGIFVTRIEGDYTNVVGFPMGEFCHRMRTGDFR